MSTNSTKTVKGRIQNKHNTESAWYIAGTATSPFIPLNGELIIYDPDSINKEKRLKLGDGVTPVHLLPFFAGEGKCIIDVIELPTENINEDAFYRLLIGTFVYNQFTQNSFTCYCVETLPEVGEPATTDMKTITAYYNMSDGACYAYVDSALSSAMGVPVGWYDGSVLLPAAGHAYGGVVTSLDEATLEDTFYLLLEHVVHSYKNGWTALKFIGKNGTGSNAEIFNHPSNIASGDASHAEGQGTTASGNRSHTEGYYTTASGDNSHTEGYSTAASGLNSHAEGSDATASGSSSHAEGIDTNASGDFSHAEGNNTTASGYNSHVEGVCTIANGLSQHVQGEYNIMEEGVQPHQRGRYAHIVGNGNAQKRSNAHTLAWNGDAWYQGNVYVGGTGQDDATAKKLITETELDSKGYLTEHQPIKTINGKSLIGEGDILIAEGSSGGIIDTEKLPTENINIQSFYRAPIGKVVKAEIAVAGSLMPELGEVEVVDVLPSIGKPAINLADETYYVYYLTSENALYVYITALLAIESGMSEGWHKPEDLGVTAHVVDSVEEAITSDLYVVVTRQPQLFHYVKDKFERIASESDLEDYKAIKEVSDSDSNVLDTHSLYRSQGKVAKVEAIINQEIMPNATCDVVDTLPEVDKPFMDASGNLHFVYQRSDDLIYGYANDQLAAQLGLLLTGWFTLDLCLLVISTINLDSALVFGGNISSIEQATDPTKVYALITREARKPNLHYYREVENDLVKGEIGAGYSEFVKTKVESDPVEILPEKTFTIEQDLNALIYNATLSETQSLLKANNKYIITYNNETYERIGTVYRFPDSDFNVVVAGNELLFGGEDNGDPFVVFCGITNDHIFTSIIPHTHGTHTIAIQEVAITLVEEEVIHKIDPKYYDTGSGGSPMTSITYNELKALRDNNSLVPGMFYRITDYECTTTEANTGTMANQFDIIIQALNESTLSETASADRHEGDTYFADTNFGAWEVKYCLDHDASRFGWAKGQQLTCLSNDRRFRLGDILIRAPKMDGKYNYIAENNKQCKYAWSTETFIQQQQTAPIYYIFTTDKVITGDTYYAIGDSSVAYSTYKFSVRNIFEIATVEGDGDGYGIIYYMKDEFGNECPYDFKNITYKGDSITGYDRVGLSADTYYPTFTNTALITYSQWGSTWGVSRNSSLDTSQQGVTYYGYTCFGTPTAWSSADFYITDAEISSSSTMYNIVDGTVSEISYGGSLSANKSLENSISGNVHGCKIARTSYQGTNRYGLSYNIFVGNQRRNILGENCSYNTFDSESNFNIFEAEVSSCLLIGQCSYNKIHINSYEITLEYSYGYDSRITPLEERLAALEGNS